MVLTIDLKFLIVSYFTSNTIIKLCKISKICQDSRFWSPLVDQITDLEYQAIEITTKVDKIDKNDLQQIDAIELIRDKIYNNTIKAFATIISIYNKVAIPIEFNTLFNNILIISNITISDFGIMIESTFITRLKKNGYLCFKDFNGGCILIIVADHPILSIEITSITTTAKEYSSCNLLKVSRFVDYLINV